MPNIIIYSLLLILLSGCGQKGWHAERPDNDAYLNRGYGYDIRMYPRNNDTNFLPKNPDTEKNYEQDLIIEDSTDFYRDNALEMILRYMEYSKIIEETEAMSNGLKMLRYNNYFSLDDYINYSPSGNIKAIREMSNFDIRPMSSIVYDSIEYYHRKHIKPYIGKEEQGIASKLLHQNTVKYAQYGGRAKKTTQATNQK